MGKVTDTIGIVKTGLEVQVALATVEQKASLAHAVDALSDIKLQIADLKIDNMKLLEKLNTKENYELRLGVYWLKGDKDETQPFCPACYSKGTIAPMEPHHRGTRQASFRCPLDEKHHSNPYDYHQRVQVRKSGNRFPSI